MYFKRLRRNVAIKNTTHIVAFEKFNANELALYCHGRDSNRLRFFEPAAIYVRWTNNGVGRDRS